MDKVQTFRKGLVHGFGEKLERFPSFLSGKIGQEKELHDMLEEKNDCFDYKKKTSEKVEKFGFFQRG